MSFASRRAQWVTVTLAALAVLPLHYPLCAAAPAAKAAGQQPRVNPSSRAVSKAEAEAVEAVVAELKREYAAHLKDPRAAPLRPQCTWFVDHPRPLSPDAIVAALNQPLGHDGRMAAYVRWQLLSGLPPKVEAPGIVPRLIDAYAKAPPPLPRFGTSAEEKSQLDGLLKDARQEEDLRLTSILDERVQRVAELNKPILAYRDELYARLPEGFESLLAGFRDAAERTQAAAGGGVDDKHAEKVVNDAQAWAQSGTAEPRQLAQLADVVAKLRHLRSPPYYAEAKYQYRTERLGWSNRTDAVYSPKKLEMLEKLVRDAYSNAAANQAAQRNNRASNAKAR